MDAKIKILILCLLSVFTLQAQTPHLNFAARFQITSATGGDPYNIVGIVSDDLSRFTGSDVAINDSIYVIDGSDVYVLAVTSITSVVGPTVTLVANDPLDAGVSIPTGQAAILRPTNNYTLPVYISGLRDDLRSMIMNRQAQLIDEITGGGLSITDFISAGVAVPPSAPANLNGGETWRNGTTGELWASDGVKWYPFNYGPKECVDTVTVSLITVQSGGSVTTGSPLVKNTSGVWEHMYNHPSGLNLIPDGIITDVITGPRAIIQYCGIRKGSGATPNTSYYVDQSANSGFTTTKPSTNIRPLGKVSSNGDFLVNAGLLFSRDNAIGVDTIASYTALRAYVGNSNVVYVQNFTYTFNSASYTTLGGIFRKVPTGTENGGTLIAGASGVKWARDWDKVHVYPEWWVVGGYDWDGTDSPSVTTTNGIYTDAERIQAASQIVSNSTPPNPSDGGNGGKIVLGAVVKSYNVDIAINFSRNTEVIGNGVIIKRAVSPIPTLTAALSTSLSTVTVSSATGFRVGQYITVLDVTNGLGNSPFYGGYAWTENEIVSTDGTTGLMKIISISGNVLTVDRNATRVLPIGSVVIRSNYLFVQESDAGLIKISGVKFNGNWNNNGLAYHFTFDNRQNVSVFAGLKGVSVNIENCEFRNSPGENIYMNKGVISSCTSDSLFGSFVHIAAVNKDSAGVTVIGCNINNSCLSGLSQSGHNEGAITFSTNPYNTRISNNYFKKGVNGVIGTVAFSTGSSLNLFQNLTVNNNICRDFDNIITAYAPSDVSANYPRMQNINITDNIFYMCGDIVFSGLGTNIKKGKGYTFLNISGNTITDGRIFVAAAQWGTINDNTLLFNTQFHKPFLTRNMYSGVTTEINNEKSAVFLSGTNLQFAGNKIESFKYYNDTIGIGIRCNVESLGTMKDSTGTDTDFYWSQNISISDNEVSGFYRGISTMTGNFGVGFCTKQAVNFNIRSNRVTMGVYPGAAYTFGINVPPGGYCFGNTIIKVQSSQVGIIAAGPNTALNAELQGSYIANNIVDGFSGGDDIWLGDGPNCDWNITCINNMTRRQIYTTIAGRSLIANNVRTDTTNFPNLTSPPSPIQYNFFELNKSQY